MSGAAKRGLRLLALFVMLVVTFTAALTAVFALPGDSVLANVRESIPRLEDEGAYPRPFIDHAAFQLDNFTDSLMLDVALGEPSENPFVASMAMFRGVLPPGATNGDPVQLLKDSSAGTRPFPEAYARYWHGYQVVLRPALTMFTYQEVRYLNMLLLGSLSAGLIVLLWDRVSRGAAVALTAALLLGGFFVVPLSLQYSGATYIALLGSLALVLLPDIATTRRSDLELFLALGALTAFIDLLTAPLLALGLPLGVALAVRARRIPEAGARDDLVFSARVAVAWSVGYAGAWASKWVIGSIVVGQEVLAGAAGEAMLWSGATAQNSVVIEALKVNFMNMVPLVTFDPALTGVARYVFVGPFGWAALAVLVATTVLLVRFHRPRRQVVRAAVILLLVPIPYVWLALLSTHSKLHFAFTYRAQAIAVFALVYFVAASVDWARVRSRVLSASSAYQSR